MFSLQSNQYVGRNLLAGCGAKLNWTSVKEVSGNFGLRKSTASKDIDGTTREIVKIQDPPASGIDSGVKVYLSSEAAENITSANYFGVAQDNIYVSSDKTYCASLYAKGAGKIRIHTRLSDSLDNYYGEVTNYQIKTVDSSSWERLSWKIDNPSNSFLRLYFDFFPESDCEVCGFMLSEGSALTPYAPALEDCIADFIEPNLINGTKSSWSDWITPPLYDAYNSCTSMFYKTRINLTPQDILVFFGEAEISGYAESSDPGSNGVYEKSTEIGFQIHAQVDGVWYFEDPVVYYMNPAEHSLYFSRKTLKDGTYRFYSIMLPDGSSMSNSGQLRIIPWFGNRLYSIGFRFDNWGAGKIRYRKFGYKIIKTKDINPIWCKSIMDIANPNILTGKYNISLSNTESGQINDIDIDDCPNPNVTSGISIIRLRPSQATSTTTDNVGVRLIENIDLVPGKSYTFSTYLRGADGAKTNLMLYTYGGIQTTTQVVPTKEWKKYSHTMTIPEGGEDVRPYIHVIGVGTVEACGWKFEEGDEVTAWTPYATAAAAATLEIDQEEL